VPEGVLLGNALIAFDAKIIRLGDAPFLLGRHHDRCGKGDLLARPERKSGMHPKGRTA
jgi:hypothetical protein